MLASSELRCREMAAEWLVFSLAVLGTRYNLSRYI
jgi:hypothetical protein